MVSENVQRPESEMAFTAIVDVKKLLPLHQYFTNSHKVWKGVTNPIANVSVVSKSLIVNFLHSVKQESSSWKKRAITRMHGAASAILYFEKPSLVLHSLLDY